jgi:hypothetical protein
MVLQQLLSGCYSPCWVETVPISSPVGTQYVPAQAAVLISMTSLVRPSTPAPLLTASRLASAWKRGRPGSAPPWEERSFAVGPGCTWKQRVRLLALARGSVAPPRDPASARFPALCVFVAPERWKPVQMRKVQSSAMVPDLTIPEDSASARQPAPDRARRRVKHPCAVALVARRRERKVPVRAMTRVSKASARVGGPTLV